MDIVVVTPPHPIKGELNYLEKMIDLGIDRIHLRKESFDLSFYRSLMQTFVHVRWVIHTTGDQFFGHSYDYHLKASHRKLFSTPKGFISTGIRKVEDLICLKKYQYGFISPMYPSISKPNYRPTISPEQWFAKVQEQNLLNQVVPLGGIDFLAAKTLQKIGFRSVALLGHLWEKPSQSIERIQRIIAL